MLNNITVGKYFNVYSRIHNINPFVKLICLILIIFVSFMTYNYISMTILYIITFLNISMTNVPFTYYLKNILNMKVLIVFIILINLIFRTSIYTIGLIILQLIVVILSSSILLYTTKQSDLIYGLEKLFYPLKAFRINNKKIALILTISIRFIPDILMLSDKIIKSQASRGIDYYNGSFKEKMIALKSMLVPLIVNSFKGSNMLASTMEVRLYDVNSNINFKSRKLKFYDYYYLVLNVSMLLMLVVKDVFL